MFHALLPDIELFLTVLSPKATSRIFTAWHIKKIPNPLPDGAFVSRKRIFSEWAVHLYPV